LLEPEIAETVVGESITIPSDLTDGIDFVEIFN